MKTTIAKKYANAIFAINLNKTILDTMVNEINLLSKIILNTKLSDFFVSPIFSLEERLRLCKKFKLSVLAEQCLRLLLVNHRILLLPELACCLSNQLDEKLEQLRVRVVVGCQLTKLQLCVIEANLIKIFKRKIIVIISLESELRSGILIEAGGFVFVNTLNQYLFELRNVLCR